MAWEAPNLFGQYLQNTGKNAGAVFSFISQLMGRQERAGERDKADKQATIVGTAELSKQRETNDYLNQVSEGDASSGVFVPPTKVDWVTEQVKGMFLGRAMSDPIQYQNALLRNKELLARGIGTSLDNDEKIRQLQEDIDSRSELAKLSGLPDSEIATKPLTGKKLYDAALSKMQNDVASRAASRTASEAAKFFNGIGDKVFSADASQYPAYVESFKDGKPTAETGAIYNRLKPVIEADEIAKAKRSPTVLAAELRTKYGNDKLSEVDSKMLASAIISKRNAESDLADPLKGSYGKEQLDKIIRDANSVIDRFTPKGAANPAAPTVEQKQNVTKGEYDKLKSGDLYWWNGKQIPKQ